MSTHFGARPTGVKFATMVTMMVVMLWSEDCLIGRLLKRRVTLMTILIFSEPKKRDMWLKIWFSALEAVEGEV